MEMASSASASDSSCRPSLAAAAARLHATCRRRGRAAGGAGKWRRGRGAGTARASGAEVAAVLLCCPPRHAAPGFGQQKATDPGRRYAAGKQTPRPGAHRPPRALPPAPQTGCAGQGRRPARRCTGSAPRHSRPQKRRRCRAPCPPPPPAGASGRAAPARSPGRACAKGKAGRGIG